MPLLQIQNTPSLKYHCNKCRAKRNFLFFFLFKWERQSILVNIQDHDCNHPTTYVSLVTKTCIYKAFQHMLKLQHMFKSCCLQRDLCAHLAKCQTANFTYQHMSSFTPKLCRMTFSQSSQWPSRGKTSVPVLFS